MRLSPQISARIHRLHSFTLVELLVVMAIGSLLAVISVATVTTIAHSQTLGNNTQMIAGSLDLARQSAITHDARVEFRLYQLPDYSASSTATPTVYRAFQTFLVTDNTTNALTKVTLLSAPMVISANTAICSIANIPAVSGSSFTQGSAGASSPQMIPGFQNNYNAIVIDFTPSGGLSPTASLTASSTWYMTLLSEYDPIVANNLPKNFATIQIDPFSGQTRTFRP